jgi:TolB-like protein
MSSTGPIPQRPLRSVFLSYASEDRKAAQTLRDALPAFGLDVWYDESELTGGDAWDQKIRRQIRECDFFMPLISARTEARHEGYFRREWRLAVERTLDMADDHTFLLPIVIDDTNQAGARVPEKFLAVQWTRLPDGKPTAAFAALCRRLAAGETKAAAPLKPASVQFAGGAGAAIASLPVREYPQFPLEEPGQKTRFWFRVVGWGLQWLWVTFNRLPKWIRFVAYLWLFSVLFLKACSSHKTHVGTVADSGSLSPAAARKLSEISDSYHGTSNKADIAKLATQIAQAVSHEVGDRPAAGSPLLAIPFSAPSADPAAQKLADSTFAEVYGRVAVSHHGHVGLAGEPLASLDPTVALERGRANKSNYVLYGAIDTHPDAQVLTVKLADVEDDSIVWSKSYPVMGADAAKIAAEVDSKIPRLDED